MKDQGIHWELCLLVCRSTVFFHFDVALLVVVGLLVIIKIMLAQIPSLFVRDVFVIL